MKFTTLATSLLFALAIAAPIDLDVSGTLDDKPHKDKPKDKPQSSGGGGGGCSVGFVFARGSTEPSPIVILTPFAIFFLIH
jgi:hypothetical protein